MHKLVSSPIVVLLLGCGANSGVIGESDESLAASKDMPSQEPAETDNSSDDSNGVDTDEAPTTDGDPPIVDPGTNATDTDEPAEDMEMNPIAEDPGLSDGEDPGISDGTEEEVQSPPPDPPDEPAPCSNDTPIDLPTEEAARRLATLLFDAPPSPELLALAAQGELSTYGDAECLALEMIQEAPAADGLRAFLESWLELGSWTFEPNDAVSTVVWEEMLDETSSFLHAFASSDDTTLRHLLTESTSQIGPALAMHYGLGAPPDPDAFVQLPQRRGLLTLGQLMASLGRMGQRGNWVVSRFQCVDVAPPRADLPVVAPAQGQTFREAYEDSVSSPACAGCHVIIDGPGAALDNFDVAGRPQVEEHGLPIDTSGELRVDRSSSNTMSFEDADGFMAALGTNPLVDDCLARTALRHATGVSTADASPGEVDDLAARFTSAERDLKHLLVALTQSDRFWQ